MVNSRWPNSRLHCKLEPGQAGSEGWPAFTGSVNVDWMFITDTCVVICVVLVSFLRNWGAASLASNLNCDYRLDSDCNQRINPRNVCHCIVVMLSTDMQPVWKARSNHLLYKRGLSAAIPLSLCQQQQRSGQYLANMETWTTCVISCCLSRRLPVRWGAIQLLLSSSHLEHSLFPTCACDRLLIQQSMVAIPST